MGRKKGEYHGAVHITKDEGEKSLIASTKLKAGKGKRKHMPYSDECNCKRAESRG